jgi:hypothetical protein
VVSGANAAAALKVDFKNNYNEAQTALSVNLSGSSVKPDPLSISPNVLAFGAKVLPAGGSVPVDAKDLTVSNTSTVAVPITAKDLGFGNTLSIPGSPFSIDPDAAKSTCLASSVASSGLAPASSCKFSIRFSPAAEIKEHAASVTLSYTDSAVSVPVTPFSKALSLSGSVIQGLKIFANEYQTCVITGTENAFCLGNNTNGVLGTAGPNNFYPPTNTTVQAWSTSGKINFGSGARVKDISIGGSHTCAIIDYPALLRSGEATCWGSGAYGKLGKGNLTNFTAPELSGGTIVPINFGGASVKQISAGESHTCALLSTNEVKCFGSNISGVLGTGTATNSVIGDQAGEMGVALQKVAFNTASAPVHLSAGAGHNCVAFADGEARCWGSNFYGQLGQVMLGGYGSTAGAFPTGDVGAMASLNAIPVGFAVSKIYAGRNGVTCAVKADGTSVRCFGKQSADADSSMTASSFAGLLGGRYCRNSNGTDVVACGSTTKPALGIGNQAGDLAKIALINFGSGENVRELAIGRSFTCAILTSNAVKCFGHDNYGQLGIDSVAGGTITNLATPGVAIPASTTEYPVKIAAGFDHACVVTNLNQVKCWGNAIFNCTGTKGEPGYTQFTELHSAVAAPYVYRP